VTVTTKQKQEEVKNATGFSGFLLIILRFFDVFGIGGSMASKHHENSYKRKI
jgi:hypothetical protein